MIRYTAILFLLAIASSVHAQKQIVIATKNTQLVLVVANNQRVQQAYLGKNLSHADLEQLRPSREVYLTAGMENQFEPAIRMIHADGNPSLELKYLSHSAGVGE